MKTKGKFYPDDFKLKVCQEYLQSDLSLSDMMSKYNIQGKNNIRRWIVKFGLESPTHCIMSKSKPTSKSKEQLKLESRIKELEKALEHEKLRSLAFSTMIDVAEEELKINIRKKSGSKQ